MTFAATAELIQPVLLQSAIHESSLLLDIFGAQCLHEDYTKPRCRTVASELNDVSRIHIISFSLNGPFHVGHMPESLHARLNYHFTLLPIY